MPERQQLVPSNRQPSRTCQWCRAGAFMGRLEHTRGAGSHSQGPGNLINNLFFRNLSAAAFKFSWSRALCFHPVLNSHAYHLKRSFTSLSFFSSFFFSFWILRIGLHVFARCPITQRLRMPRVSLLRMLGKNEGFAITHSFWTGRKSPPPSRMK